MMLELLGHDTRRLYDPRAAVDDGARRSRRTWCSSTSACPGCSGYDVAAPAARQPGRRAAGAGRGHRLGPARRSPPHRRGRLRPPPGQAAGNGGDPPDLRRAAAAADGARHERRACPCWTAWCTTSRGRWRRCRPRPTCCGRDDLPPERRRELLDTVERQSRRLGADDRRGRRLVPRRAAAAGSRRDRARWPTLIDSAIGAIPGCPVEPRHPRRTRGARSSPATKPRLLQMLMTLIRHACARDPDRTPGLVVARCRDGVRITVSDQGPALDAAAWPACSTSLARSRSTPASACAC